MPISFIPIPPIDAIQCNFMVGGALSPFVCILEPMEILCHHFYYSCL